MNKLTAISVLLYCISIENTVKFHKKKLFEKLHAENITEAVGIAANLRLI
ncbi:LuxR C-terminal-related transcriptional regulator [uncultured Bacteroides sp.]|nr:LuxR C-terminal-related transcriptional regulator [uncultured Bacteroides sp.]